MRCDCREHNVQDLGKDGSHERRDRYGHDLVARQRQAVDGRKASRGAAQRSAACVRHPLQVGRLAELSRQRRRPDEHRCERAEQNRRKKCRENRYRLRSGAGQPDQTTLRDGSDNTQGRHCPRITQAYVSEDKKSRDD